MKRYALILLGSLGAVGFLLLLAYLAHAGSLPVLFPAGAVAIAERDLMLRAVFLMLIVVVPVYALIAFFAWHYREGNEKAAYTPKWEHSKMEELIWWSIPFEIVLVLAALAWGATHELDPGRALASNQPPLVIDVVALPWKWVFIYPSEGVASVNEVALPVGRPVQFDITADAPMNSFWIPALGGQEYAMPGMTTILHLIANVPGTYPGRSANYSGDGFAQMQFAAKALPSADFEAWVRNAHAAPAALTPEAYAALAHPSDAGPVRYYGTVTIPFSDIVRESMGMDTSSSMMHSHE